MAIYINLETKELASEDNIRAANPNTSYPYPFPVPDGYAVVFDVPQPTFDQYSEVVTLDTPKLTTKGHYEQSWKVTKLKGDDLKAAKERKVQDESIKEANRIEALWTAASKFEQQSISGSAIGLITMGVIQKKPKSIAVQQWIKSIWDEYYIRKSDKTNFDLDFSIIAEIPYTVPELMLELGL